MHKGGCSNNVPAALSLWVRNVVPTDSKNNSAEVGNDHCAAEQREQMLDTLKTSLG